MAEQLERAKETVTRILGMGRGRSDDQLPDGSVLSLAAGVLAQRLL